MRAFFKRHLFVHIWALGVLALFAVYWYGASSPAAANAVCAVTQRLKDGYAGLWYLFPFSVVEWFYAVFILGSLAWLAILLRRLLVRREGRGHAAYGGLLGLACLFLTAYGFYCVMWGVNYYADGFQVKSGVYARPVAVEELERVEAMRRALGSRFCRRCGYCAPCHAGIDIPNQFVFHGYLSRYGLADWAKARYGALSAHASDCMECGACEGRCPYQLPIREMLKKIAADFGF